MAWGLLVALIWAGGMTLAIAVPLYYAWIASILWAWFVAPTFGLPELGVLQLWGVCLCLGVMRPRVDLYKHEIDWGKITNFLINPLIALATGYVLKGYL